MSAPAAPPVLPPQAAARWQRLHPVTPVLRSWRVLVVLLLVYGQQRGAGALGGGEDAPGRAEVLIALGSLLGAVVVAIGLSALSWRATRFSVGAEELQLHSGVLFRRQRSARLDRLQAVDVVQPLFARLLGFAELRVEVAGGAGSQVRLAYLREVDAQRLRNALLAGSAGLAYEGEDAPEAEAQWVAVVPLGRVAGAVALSSSTAVLVAVVLAFGAGAVLGRSPAVLLGAGPVLLGLLGGVWTAFTRSAGWRVGTSADGLRLRSGLLDSRTQTVPPGRVQAVRLDQPLLWRLPGWWRVRVNVAGFAGAGGRGEQEASLLLPVATRGEVERVLELVLPALPGALGAAGLTAAMSGRAAARRVAHDGWLASPPRARWVDPVAWSRSGALVTTAGLVLRRGRLHREVDVVPHERTQSLGLDQGPLQRRLGLAGVVVHSTPGPVRPRVDHLDAAAAAVLLRDQAARARTARASAGPERWMRAPAPAP